MNVVAYSWQFQEMFLSKDIFLIPYYIAKESGGDCKYFYTHNLGNTDIPKQHRGVTIERTRSKNQWMVFLKEILPHAKDIDVLFLTGSSAVHMAATFLYKRKNPSGNVVVFGDMEEPQARELNMNGFHYSGGLSGLIKGKLTEFFCHNVTYLVANTVAYNLMADLFRRKGWHGLLHFYPCLDDELFLSYGLTRRPFADKENIMVCVGRIGCWQKNTEMLLDALRRVDLGDWKIYMLGPITSSFDLKEGNGFQKEIDRFFQDCPQHQGKLVFTGMIYEQKQVFEYYNRAKVLLMTSRHESWGNVFSEAAALGCFIISTDVGGATLTSNNWKFGCKIENENSVELATAIKGIVNGTIYMDEKKEVKFNDLRYTYMVNKILLPRLEFVSEK